MTSSTRGRVARSGLALLLGLVLASLLAEGVARWRYNNPAAPPPEHRAAPLGMFKADAAAGYALSRSYQQPGADFSSNAMGFRDRPREPGPAPDGTLRVAVLGDSFTAGSTVGDQQHFSYLLEEVVAAAGGETPVANLELWNLGVPHYGIEQSALQLMDRWDEVQPQAVVLNIFAGNDCWDDVLGPSGFKVIDGEIIRSGWAPWGPSRHKDTRAHLNRPLFAYSLPGDSLAQRYSYAYRLGLQSVSRSREAGSNSWPWGMEPFDYEAFGGVAWLFLEPAPPPVRACWALTQELLSDLKRDVEARGARLLLLDFPSRIRVQTRELETALQRGWRMGPRPGGGSRNQARTFVADLPEKRLRKIAGDLDLPLRELRPALAQAALTQSMHHPGDSHWTAAGHRVAAAELAALLAGQGLLDESLALLARSKLLVGQGIGTKGAHPDMLAGTGPAQVEPTAIGDPAGDRQVSDVIARMIDPAELLRILPATPPGWTVASAARSSVGPPPALQWRVLAAQAQVVLRDPRGGLHHLLAIDSAGQPEFDHWWRKPDNHVLTGPVPEGMLPSTARLGVIVLKGDPDVLKHVDKGSLKLLEESLRPPPAGPRVHDVLIMAEKASATSFDPAKADQLHDPRQLLAALSPAPAGWQTIESMPLYRDHGIPSRIKLPADLEALVLEHQDELSHHDPPWSSQVKRWYRGPEGSFALVVQDNGRSEALIRARQKRLSRVRQKLDPAKPSQASKTKHKPDDLNAGADIRAWSFGKLQGYHTCMRQLGLCKVVVPLADPGDPKAALTRYTAILMGPPDAPDEAYGLIISGIQRDSLP